MNIIDICPNWGKILLTSPERIDEYISINEKITLNIKILSRCPVGEAWGFTADYAMKDFPTNPDVVKCTDCCEFGSIYGSLVYREYGTFKRLKSYTGEELIRFIDNLNREFVKHFEACHKDLYIHT